MQNTFDLVGRAILRGMFFEKLRDKVADAVAS